MKRLGWLIAIILVLYAVVEIELLSRMISPEALIPETVGKTLGQVLLVWIGYSIFARKYKPASPRNAWKLKTVIALILINHLLYNVGKEISWDLAYEHVNALIAFNALKFLFLCFSVYLAWKLDRKDVGDGRTFGLRFITVLQLALLVIAFVVGFQGGYTRNKNLMNEYTSLVNTVNSDAEILSEKFSLLEKIIDQQDWTRYHDEALIALDLYAQYVRSSKNLSDFLEKNKSDLLRLGMNVQDNVEMMSEQMEIVEEEHINVLKENIAYIESENLAVKK